MINVKTYALFTTLLFIICSSTWLHSQRISGQVSDSTGQVVPYASVVATGCSDDAPVLSFTTTDDKGKYQLVVKTECDSITLTARSLGYKTAALRIPGKMLPLNQDFILGSAIMQEVLIRAKTPPVMVRNDTTEYNVASFSDSTEFSVEDLLKKLPGVSIDGQGLISYNGKLIERVLIEGDDLFSQNYPIATRNVRADMVSKVQVIDKFQENPLLKEVQETDRMVMNLKIKPDRKRDVSGSVTGGLGYGDEWKARAHTNLFSLGRKHKFYLIGSANNAGENAISDVNWLNSSDIFDASRQSLQASPLQAHGVLQAPQMQSVGLPEPYTQKNSGKVLFLGDSWPVTPDFKVKISGWVGDERLEQQRLQQTSYLLDTSILEIFENSNVSVFRGVQNLQAESEFFAPNRKYSLRSFAKISNRPSNSHFDLQRGQPDVEDFQVSSPVNGQSTEAFANVEYTRKMKENAVFQIIGKTAWYRNHDALASQYAWYPLFFATDTSFTHLYETVAQRQSRSQLSARVLANRFGMQWLLEMGGDWRRDQLLSDIRLQNAAGEVWQPNAAEYGNNAQLRSYKYFTHIDVKRVFGAMQVRARLNVRYHPSRLIFPTFSEVAPRTWAAMPRLDLRYGLGEFSVINGSYEFRQEAPDFNSMYNAFILTDYQSLYRGYPDLSFLPGHQAALRFVHNNRIHQYSWNIGGKMTLARNAFGSQYQIDPFLVVLRGYRPVNHAVYTLNAGGYNYFPRIKSRFEVGFLATILREQAKINSESLRNLYTNNYTAIFKYGTAFDTWVNLLFDGSISRSVLRGEAPLNATSWSCAYQVLVKPSKSFNLKISVQQVSNRVGMEPSRIFYAADGIASFQIPKWRSEVALKAFNLLGTRRFEQSFLNTFIQNYTYVTAVKRFFLLSWSYSF